MDIDLKVSENRALLSVRGSLNSDNAPQLQEKLNEVLKSDIKYLDIDFFECDNISSTAIGKLLLFYKDFISKGGEMEVIRCSTPIYELFNMLKLNQLFTVNLG